jgi:putative salt-induced outer membrane protein YdiY
MQSNPTTKLFNIWLCMVACAMMLWCGHLFAFEDNDNDNTKLDAAIEETSAEEKKSAEEAAAKTKAAWDAFFPPPDDKFDWLQLTSGEWLKGELRAMYSFSLEFDSDEMGLQKFDWEDVKQIRSAGYQSLSIERDDRKRDPLTVVGVLHLTEDKAKLTAGDQVLEFDRDKIISISVGSTKEADLWVGDISLGFNIRSGNSELIDSTFSANAKRRTSGSRIVIDYVGNFSKAESVETSNNHRLNSYLDLFRTRNSFWRVVSAEYYRDRFKNINNQLSLGTAFGYQIIRNSKTEWEVSGGVGVLYKQFVSVEAGENSENTSPALGLGTKYETDVTKWLEFLFDFSFQLVDKDSGTYIHHMVSTLESDLIGDLELDISFVWDRVENPQPAEDGTVPQQDDFQLIVGISYEF